jgi:hypothetical protein
MKNAVFWDIRTQFVPHRKHYVSATGPSPLMQRFEVFMAVSKKNAVMWDVTPCDICKHPVSGTLFSSFFLIPGDGQTPEAQEF